MATLSSTFLETGVREIGGSESETMLDAAAKRYLQMSGPEFVEAWNEGRFGPDPDSVPA